jgi:hypothetical protein
MKGQQEALSAVLISGILIGVVGSVYFWGIPLIQKNKDNSILETSETFMASLDAKIKFVANNGGRDRIVIKIPGIVRFDGRSVELKVETEGTIYAVDSPIPLGRTSTGALKMDPATSNLYGTWGIDDPVLFTVKSSEISKSKYVTRYTLEYVQLRNDKTLNDYKIDLIGSGVTGGEDRTIIIESLGDRTTAQSGRTLISSLVKISIV